MYTVRKKLGKLINALSAGGMAVTFVLMCITTLDVILRKVSTISVRGSYELTEMGMVILIFFGIAALQVARGHVRVDMFAEKFPRGFRLALDVVVMVVEAGIMGLMTYCGYLKTVSDFDKGLGTSVLGIPTWPFAALMTIGLLLFTVMLLIDAILSAVALAKGTDVELDEINTDLGE